MISSEIIFKCASCRTELDFFDIHHLPGEEIYDIISGMRFSTSQNYCKKCYEELTVQNLDKEKLDKLESKKSFGLEKIDEIKDLERGQININLVVDVINKQEKKVEKNGRPLRLGQFKIKDNSGEIELVLWEKIIDLIKKDDKLVIKNGFIRSFMNQKQVTLGKKGELINLSKKNFSN